MIYIDSMIPIYAILRPDEKGKRARKLMERIQNGDEEAITSALTFDEVFWKVKKEKGHLTAVEAIEAFLEMPNLTFIDVDDTVLWQALSLIKKHRLDPRDAIHLACAITHGVYTIVSEDSDFDTIPEVNRRKL